MHTYLSNNMGAISDIIHMDTINNISKKLNQAYSLEDFMRARILIHEYLNLTIQIKELVDYGFVVHHAHTLRGLIKLKSGDIEGAKNDFVNSILFHESKKISTSGPNMLLAYELLLHSEEEVVLSFFKICEKKWKAPEAKRNISTWTKEIGNQRMPDFGSLLRIHLDF